MLTTREVIKTFYNALLQRLEKHRGDWNQNDPTADDYIKNRPFYTDETKKIVNVPEQKITIPDDGPPAQLVLPEFIEFVTGQTYEVKWDDKTYSCVAFDLEGISTIGNQVVLGGTNTGEPFIMQISKVHKFGGIIPTTPEAIGTHTVEVTTTKVVTLDRKYLPDLGFVTSVAISNGGGLKVADSPITTSGTITIAHGDKPTTGTATANSGRTYIQNIALDTYGHVANVTTATETVVDTGITDVTANNGLIANVTDRSLTLGIDSITNDEIDIICSATVETSTNGLTSEDWRFTLSNGSTVTKKVVVVE